MLGPFEREDALAAGAPDHTRVHLSRADRRQGLLGLVSLVAASSTRPRRRPSLPPSGRRRSRGFLTVFM